MLDLGARTVELLVGRIQAVGGGGAWDGEFRQELEERFLKPPPEQGRPAADVVEQVAHTRPASGR